VASLVYLATRSNTKLTDELARAGYRVFEAQAVSEALYLCETENVDVIGTQRATVWEVHPITRIQVQRNGQWVDLDTQQ
jgi:hypothetical protein